MIFTKIWWKAAAVRAVKTMSQTAIAIIPAAVTITAVDWLTVAGTAALAGVLSLLTSLAGLPEVREEQAGDDDKGRITVKAYKKYDEDGSPIVDGECAACDLTPFLEDAKGDGDGDADR